MNTSFYFPTIQMVNNAENYLALQSIEWTGRIVTALKSSLVYLEDPRIASSAIFIGNFMILELAGRTSRLLSRCLPGDSQSEKMVKSSFEMALTAGLTLAGNVAFIKATAIELPLSIMATLIGTTFIIKYNLENYLNQQPAVG